MFTGLVEGVGRLQHLQRRGPDAQLRVQGDLGPLQLGESIAVNGVCLTVSGITRDGFEADASQETLSLTTLGQLTVGAQVNLERATPAGGRLGGHIVLGHVDGVGSLLSCRLVGSAQCLRFQAPAALARYLAPKGSIAIDGVSLTINRIENNHDFEVMLVPHTQRMTILPEFTPGTQVNLEVDVLARYVARQLEFIAAADAPAPDLMGTLRRGGYLD